MPRQKDASQQEVFHVSFVLPRDVYQRFRLISAKTTIGMRELYKRACEEFAAEKEPTEMSKREVDQLREKTQTYFVDHKDEFTDEDFAIRVGVAPSIFSYWLWHKVEFDEIDSSVLYQIQKIVQEKV